MTHNFWALQLTSVQIALLLSLACLNHQCILFTVFKIYFQPAFCKYPKLVALNVKRDKTNGLLQFLRWKPITGSRALVFHTCFTLNFLRPDDSWGDRRGPAAAVEPSEERWPTAPPISRFNGDINAHLNAWGRLHSNLWTFPTPLTAFVDIVRTLSAPTFSHREKKKGAVCPDVPAIFGFFACRRHLSHLHLLHQLLFFSLCLLLYLLSSSRILLMFDRITGGSRLHS